MLKRFISILLTVVMVSTLGGGRNFGQNVEVKAATAGITNGATYTIVSAYNEMCIRDSSITSAIPQNPPPRLSYPVVEFLT